MNPHTLATSSTSSPRGLKAISGWVCLGSAGGRSTWWCFGAKAARFFVVSGAGEAQNSGSQSCHQICGVKRVTVLSSVWNKYKVDYWTSRIFDTNHEIPWSFTAICGNFGSKLFFFFKSVQAGRHGAQGSAELCVSKFEHWPKADCWRCVEPSSFFVFPNTIKLMCFSYVFLIQLAVLQFEVEDVRTWQPIFSQILVTEVGQSVPAAVQQRRGTLSKITGKGHVNSISVISKTGPSCCPRSDSEKRWLQLPILELDGKDRGKLLETLRRWGAVHLAPGWDKADIRRDSCDSTEPSWNSCCQAQMARLAHSNDGGRRKWMVSRIHVGPKHAERDQSSAEVWCWWYK